MLIFWVTCVHMNLLHPKVNIHLNKGLLQAAQGCLGCLALRTESCLRVKICQCCVVLRSQGRLAGWGRWSSGDVGRVPLASLSPGHCCTISQDSSRRVKLEAGTGRDCWQHLCCLSRNWGTCSISTPQSNKERWCQRDIFCCCCDFATPRKTLATLWLDLP